MVIAVLGATVAAALAVHLHEEAAASEDPPQVVRLAGADRFATGARAARHLWPEGAGTVVVATGFDYPDALAGAPVAAASDAPLLLATTDELPDAVREAIIEMAPDAVRLMGGQAVLSSQLADEIRDLPGEPDVARIAGADRFATAVEAAQAAGGYADADVAVATGFAFADALSASSLTAGADPVPVVLASGEQVEADISAAVRALLVGGPGALSAGVAQEAEAQTGNARRLAGSDRWATSQEVADFTLGERLVGDAPLVLATGRTFADALSGGAVTARVDGPLLLIPREGPTDAQAQWILDHHQQLTDAYVVGGTNAISASGAERIGSLLAGDEPTDDRPEPLPRVVTTDTPDGVYTMRVDDSSRLELPEGTSSPEVSGSAVEVFPIASFADSGKSAWEIRAVEAGESTIVATVDDQQHVWTIRVSD